MRALPFLLCVAIAGGACREPATPPPAIAGPVSVIASVPAAKVLTPIIVDSILKIPLKNGDTSIFVSDPHQEMSTIYKYDQHFDRSGFHGVSGSYYESFNYFLVDDSTGARFTIDNRPLPSPSGRRMVVASLDLEGISVGNALTVFRVAPNGLVEEWRWDSMTWGPKDPVWIGEDTVTFTRVWAREERRALRESPARLIRGRSGWKLTGVVPDTLPEDSTEVH